MDELFNSNRPPSPQEWASTQSLLELCDQELTPVEGQIADLQKQLDKLISRRSTLQTNRRKYLDILSARRRLPPRNYRYLHTAGRDPPPYDGDLPQQPRLGSALPFMLVSKEWYETVCGFGYFWTQLKLDVAAASEEEILHLLEMASKRVQRASELTLSLTVILSTSNEWNDKVFEFAHSISSHVGAFDISIEDNRDPIHRLELSSSPGPNPNTGSGLLALLLRHPLSPARKTLDWPKLHTVCINMQTTHPPSYLGLRRLEDVFSAPEKFPVMSGLTIAAPQYYLWALNMPWSSLSTLSLGPFYSYKYRHYFSVLKQCAERLRVLNLFLCGTPEKGETLLTEEPIIHLVHLTHFRLECAEGNDYFSGVLLSYLRLPSLQSLTWTGSYSRSETRDIVKLIQESGCQESLRYLELNNVCLFLAATMMRGGLRSVFMETPRLSRLKISGYELSPRLWSIIPETVQDLTVQMWFPVIGDLRPSFTEFLRSRSLSAVPSSTPMKARLDIIDDTNVASARDKIKYLKAEFGSLSNLVVSL
ncbi:hypothetical protein H1R20_g11169, partial [Candolleomyces eurysporus]